MNLISGKMNRYIFLTLFFGLLPIWNIPHTIAARYVLASLLLLIVIISDPGWKEFFRKNLVLLAFFAYLLFHLFFLSNNFESALNNFRAEWMYLVLFSVLGAGTGLVISKDRPSRLMLYLGIAFAVPLLIHLGVSLNEGLNRGAIPWGYWGISEIHGDLGYTAIHATIFLSVFFLFLAKRAYEKTLALLLLFTCIASPLLASSRGGTAFVLILLIAVFSIDLAIKFEHKLTLKKQLLGIVVVLMCLIAVMKIGAAVDPGRWNGVLTRLQMGLKGNPLQVTCEGVGVLKKALEDEGVVIGPEISQALNSIQDGDGARVMTARTALVLVGANPLGIDQSKEAYQIALSRVCDPAIRISHAHNGWIDTALAIGIPGAILYFLVLLNFARLGYRSMRLDGVNKAYAVALFTLSSIWIVRALFDSTQRDQMLEMQVFTIAFLYGFILSNSRAQHVRLEPNPPN